MKFESEKQRKVRERKREKTEKELQEEEVIVQQIRNTSKIVTKRVAEESGVRMYKEAQRRLIKSQAKYDQSKLRTPGGNSQLKSDISEFENYSKHSKHQPYRFQVSCLLKIIYLICIRIKNKVIK